MDRTIDVKDVLLFPIQHQLQFCQALKNLLLLRLLLKIQDLMKRQIQYFHHVYPAILKLLFLL